MSGYLAEGLEHGRSSVYANIFPSPSYGQEACYRQLQCCVHDRYLINLCLLSFRIHLCCAELGFESQSLYHFDAP